MPLISRTPLHPVTLYAWQSNTEDDSWSYHKGLPEVLSLSITCGGDKHQTAYGYNLQVFTLPGN